MSSITFTESLTINGEPVEINRVAVETGSQKMLDGYSNMILGVNLSQSLEQTEKDFIISMLQDQLRIELECAVMCQS